MKNFIKTNKSYIKSIVLVLFAQAFIYFIINIIIQNHHYLNSNLNIPLIKQFIYIYHSWYPLVIITSYFIFKDDKELYKKIIFTFIISFIMAQLTFIFYPSAVIRPEIEVKTFTDYIIYLTYKFDNPTNCLPSVHALVCYIMIYYLNKSNIKILPKVLLTTYFILIILSTLFTKQHLPIDLLLALLYAVIAIILVKIFYSKLKETLKKLF